MNDWKQLLLCGENDPIREAANACGASERAVRGRELPGAAALRKRCRCAGLKKCRSALYQGSGLSGGGRRREKPSYVPESGQQLLYTENGKSSHADYVFSCSFFRLPSRRTVFMVKIQLVFTLAWKQFPKNRKGGMSHVYPAVPVRRSSRLTEKRAAKRAAPAGEGRASRIFAAEARALPGSGGDGRIMAACFPAVKALKRGFRLRAARTAAVKAGAWVKKVRA